MPNEIDLLSVYEVSLCGSPANPESTVILTKTAKKPGTTAQDDDGGKDPDPDPDDNPYDPQVAQKREFTANQRKKLADSGHALPDGSFPIVNEADLHNAIRAIGRAKNPDKAKAHIKARAAAMGMTNALPDDWKSEGGDTKKSFVIEHTPEGKLRVWHEFGPKGDDDKPEGASPKRAPSGKGSGTNATKSALQWATNLLKDAVQSVLGLPEGERAASLDKSFDEFSTFAQAVVPAGHGANGTASGHQSTDDGATNKESTMTEAEVTALQKSLADATAQIAFLSMSPAHQAFAKDMTAELKAKFAAKKPDERDKEMEDCADNATKALPESIRKQLEEAKVAKAKADALEVRVAAMEAEKQMTGLAQRAVEIGLTAKDAGTLAKARTGDADAIKSLEDKIAGLTKQVKTGMLFKEFGTSATASGDALTKLNGLAEDLRKSQPKLSQAQAFSKVYTDLANSDLVATYKREVNGVN